MPLTIEVKEKINTASHHDLSKELERISLSHMQNIAENRKKSLKSSEKLKSLFYGRIFNYRVVQETKVKLKDNYKNQLEAFQAATGPLIIVGQLFGLNPVTGASAKDISDVRLKYVSVKLWYSLTVAVLQFVQTIFCILNILYNSLTVSRLGYLAFYFTTFYTSILFLILSKRWQRLYRDILNSGLDEYIDPYIRFKCNTAVIIIYGLALVEHGLSLSSKLSGIHKQHEDFHGILQKYIDLHLPSVGFESDPRYNLPTALLVMVCDFIFTMNWNYSHVFIICISIYLTSMLEQVNRKLIGAEGQCRPASFWKKLREDYNNATKLIKNFDDVINSIVFVAFASNLFFVCLQLYNVLAVGFRITRPIVFSIHSVYFLFSLAFMLSRSLAVSLVAARVHSASLIAAPALYSVPSTTYCIEVQRFIEQVHGDVVALSGMNFFYVTRPLLLSVAGTIITYELVLLQFNVDNSV